MSETANDLSSFGPMEKTVWDRKLADKRKSTLQSAQKKRRAVSKVRHRRIDGMPAHTVAQPSRFREQREPDSPTPLTAWRVNCSRWP